jgi:nitrate reductase / nitrite oxidoreductase, alpha subunit
MGKGFEPDIALPDRCSARSVREDLARRAGRHRSKGLWRPAALGIRPGYESDAFKKFLQGDFIRKG